jgi:hypothetical protein
MSNHWLNLTFRFLLELTALFVVGYWGFSQGGDFLKYALAVFLPVTMAVCWAVFRYPNDPKKNPVIQVSGKFRLILEFAFFAIAILALYDLGHTGRGADLAFLVILHYGFSYDRVLTLFREQPIKLKY